MVNSTQANPQGANNSSHKTFQNASGPVLHPSDGVGLTQRIGINATMTAPQPSTGGESESGVPGGVIALMICLLLVGIVVFTIFFYLKRSGKLYKMIPFKPLINSRRTSFSCSDRALHVEAQEPMDADPDSRHLEELPARPRDAAMFTIEDHDMDSVDITDIDATSRGTNDEYFYDEVFGKSMFEDEATNASMRQLYLASDETEEDMLDVDALVDSITANGKKATAPKT